jgi:hypothetical protein
MRCWETKGVDKLTATMERSRVRRKGSSVRPTRPDTEWWYWLPSQLFVRGLHMRKPHLESYTQCQWNS